MIPVKFTDSGRVKFGFSAERHDCAVRAVAVRFTTSYQRAHDLLESVGRKPGKGVHILALKRLFENMGLPLIPLSIARPTLAQFVANRPTGRYFVIVRGHAVGIVNGVCLDDVPPRSRQRIIAYA